MIHNTIIYDLLSALNADIDVNKCGTVIVVLLITDYSCNIKMWVITSFARKYFKESKSTIMLLVVKKKNVL